MKLGYFLGMIALCLVSTQVYSARISDVANTKHNLSSTWGGTGTDNRTVMAQSETRICVFCHTPHAAENITGAPLWNRKFSNEVYTMYDSSSMDATAPTAPSTSSKLCLSCHDGTLAIGAVNVLNGSAEEIAMSGTGTNGVMPAGGGVTSGNTRNLGFNLTNDHPISITYDTALATADGELRNPATTAHIDVRSPGVKPAIPLVEDLGDNKVECVSCHDPHVRDDAIEDIKFLRLNRFQTTEDPTNTYSQANDIICLACHNKEGWVNSAHAHQNVADETYLDAAAIERGFPTGIRVWEAACLNCHDTHTVQGSRRLLRAGVDSGGDAAIEETCYQCHAINGGGTITPATQVPDIKSDFLLPRHMPITNGDQNVTTERHDIGTPTLTIKAKDFGESVQLLGAAGSGSPNGNGQGSANYANRHVECTDCHNPHRVVKERLANANLGSPDVAGTHDHNAVPHTNLISGVLRGTWGVEPYYDVGGASFYGSTFIYYLPKFGVPPVGGSMDVSQDYVTREYQICLKCHSNYAYDESDFTTPPSLGVFGGATPYDTNGLTNFTNQAREFQAPVTHKGLTGSPGDSGAYAGTPPIPSGLSYSVDFHTNNRRSWHPVIDSTGRGPNRGHTAADMTTSFLAPWSSGIGTQTMYCSDCHGSDTANGTAEPTGGENANPWGPHGSSNDFILKGSWATGGEDAYGASTGAGASGSETPDAICFKCHSFDAYANYSVASASNYGRTTTLHSGFAGDPSNGSNIDFKNLHMTHNVYMGNIRCTWCHVAVPHGWKNKALLVNLNDVGPEATCRSLDVNDGVSCTAGHPFSPGTQVRLGPKPDPDGGTSAWSYWRSGGKSYNNPPYYRNAVLKVYNFKNSGQWLSDDCGSVGTPGSGLRGMCSTGGKWAVDGLDGCSTMP